MDYGSRLHRGIGPEPLPALWVFDGAHPKPWQFVSYAFVHCFRWHLHGNLFALTPASLLVEWRIGPGRTLALFLVLAVMVCCGFHLIDPRDLYGASGVVAGFTTMAGMVWALAEDKPRWQRATPTLLALSYFAWSDLWPALHGHPNPGWKPHLMGALSGIAVALVHRYWHDAVNKRSRGALSA